MPTGPEPAEGRSARRVVIDPEGPVLVEGPVEVDLPDGRTARSDRFTVALCTCRRSHRFPWCDTSHRRKERRPRPGTEADADGGTERD
ncbi:CDGSH iron-sulfur domain-containing protein [Streptomyces sp. DH37]|uniref:CDGSH iron-sulfur domain-containing protein n=1 Tax=Streptomyces sp. DH37 TaxID=3040122 RepID=UPI002441691A|nr:CDGSH iron-sulfur domain-containing protein [Streptomyces sp. DH37]MDG9701260.1 CDGSH iron-sulfur domain-containing protein [Streptomyces sp. DH37]